jgi:hypothetical protein
MTPREITLLSMYKMAEADGNPSEGGKIIKEMLNFSEEEFTKQLDLDNVLGAFNALNDDAKEIVLTVTEFIMKVDGKIDEGTPDGGGEAGLYAFEKMITPEKSDDNNRKLAIYTIYAVASADGKIGGGLNKLAPDMLNLPLETIQKESDVNNILSKAKNLSSDAKEALATVAEFAMKLDKKEDSREKEIVEKLKSC